MCMNNFRQSLSKIIENICLEKCLPVFFYSSLQLKVSFQSLGSSSLVLKFKQSFQFYLEGLKPPGKNDTDFHLHFRFVHTRRQSII